MRSYFPNLTDTPDPATAAQELKDAGADFELGHWRLERRWTHWCADGPDLSVVDVAEFDGVWGRVVRAHGFAGGEGLKRMGGEVGTFHIDSPRGLKAFTAFVRSTTEPPPGWTPFHLSTIGFCRGLYSHDGLSGKVWSVTTIDGSRRLYIDETRHAPADVVLWVLERRAWQEV